MRLGFCFHHNIKKKIEYYEENKASDNQILFFWLEFCDKLLVKEYSSGQETSPVGNRKKKKLKFNTVAVTYESGPLYEQFLSILP